VITGQVIFHVQLAENVFKVIVKDDDDIQRTVFTKSAPSTTVPAAARIAEDELADVPPLAKAHAAVEDTLVMMRDMRASGLGHAHGFVIREEDGEDSSMIRLGTAHGLKIGIKAYLEALPTSATIVDAIARLEEGRP
jgi:hypothetical protein